MYELATGIEIPGLPPPGVPFFPSCGFSGHDGHRGKSTLPTATAEKRIAHDLVEKLCYIVVDYDTELKSICKREDL